MIRFLLDTGIASDFIFRRRGVFERAKRMTLAGHRVGICVPVLGELWSGVFLSATRAQNERRLQQRLSDLTLWPYEAKAARQFGQLFADLRRAGRPMPQIDIQIAAVAMTLGNCTVVTKDSDFDAIDDLDHVDWTRTE